jgi:hypothetical protein
VTDADEVSDLRRLLAEEKAKTAKLEDGLRFVRGVVHQVHHEGPADACRITTCDAIAQALGER